LNKLYSTPALTINVHLNQELLLGGLMGPGGRSTPSPRAGGPGGLGAFLAGGDTPPASPSKLCPPGQDLSAEEQFVQMHLEKASRVFGGSSKLLPGGGGGGAEMAGPSARQMAECFSGSFEQENALIARMVARQHKGKAPSC